ncbi:MAG: DUF3306 domain-containing protein [Ramlibacter sp.]
MTDGFLGRWSKRKLEGKRGGASEEVVQPEDVIPANAGIQEPRVDSAAAPESTAALDPGFRRDENSLAAAEPPPTLEDVQSLNPASDFRRFAAADVAPEVKNAAMKKLFADPRYNVMDGLDVYTGDYSQPDPIPSAMLRQLAGAKFLGLFDDEEKEATAHRDVADNPGAQSVAQSVAAADAVPAPTEHADPDLRLQQDDATPGEDPGRRTG